MNNPIVTSPMTFSWAPGGYEMMQRLIEQANTDMARQSEDAIRAAIARSLPGFTIEELAGRVGHHHAGGVDTYFLDGEPLVRLYPLEEEVVRGQIRFTRRVHVFP